MAEKNGDGAVGDAKELAKELSDIKRLLILALLRDGATQSDIAIALQTSNSTVSRMFPKGFGKAVGKA